jgi:hypothetical protein
LAQALAQWFSFLLRARHSTLRSFLHTAI